MYLKKEHHSFFGKDEYYDDDTDLKEIPKNHTINIIQNSNQCKCNFLARNEKMLTLSKKSLIERLNELSKLSDLSDDINKNSVKDFYDIIIDISSLSNVVNGWKIKTTDYVDRFNLLENSSNIKYGIIGFLGNINSGKSFIISKLTNTNILTGTIIKSDDLCIKYPNKEQNTDLNYNYIILDTKGSNQPILDKINRTKDIIAKNIFLQNFILLYSNMLLLVIDYLSKSEKIFINKIKNNIKISNDKKILIIIHNLKNYKKIEDVKNYINNILKSLSFKLIRNERITSKKDNVILGEYFVENHENNFSVFHLIFAADNSEAGVYYNTFSKYFIEINFKNICNLKNLEIIESIKKHFCLQSSMYFDTIINNEDFLSKKNIIKEKRIRFKYPKKLTFKKYFCEDLSAQILEDNYFSPKYNIFKNEKNLEIQIELPGNIKAEIFRPKYIDNNINIIIMGKKLRDKEPKNKNDNIADIRNHGNFNMNINFERRDFEINPNIKSWKIKDGVLDLIYEIEDNNQNEKISLCVDEEI